MIRNSLLLACAAVLSAGACAETPSFVAEPAQPSFDGGWTAGSGNRSSGDTTTVPRTSEGASATMCEESGGWTAGSGNQAQSTCSSDE